MLRGRRFLRLARCDAQLTHTVCNTLPLQTSFRAEVMLLRACVDPNVVAFRGAAMAPNHMLMAMELCPGGDLRKALTNDPHGHLRWYMRCGHPQLSPLYMFGMPSLAYPACYTLLKPPGLNSVLLRPGTEHLVEVSGKGLAV